MEIIIHYINKATFYIRKIKQAMGNFSDNGHPKLYIIKYKNALFTGFAALIVFN